MNRIINFVVLAAFTAVLAACSTAPAQNADLTPPGRKLDAKTQLETGRTR